MSKLVKVLSHHLPGGGLTKITTNVSHYSRRYSNLGRREYQEYNFCSTRLESRKYVVFWNFVFERHLEIM